MTLLEEMLLHAEEDTPNEACGLVVSSGKRHRLIRGKNVALLPKQQFEMHPDAWLEVQDHEQVIAIYHSHPHTSAEPSVQDLVACEASGLPWHIVCPHTRQHTLTEPSGYEAPYEGRPYLYGVLDCYSLMRDWYKREWGLRLMDFEREPSFWLKGKNTFVESFEECGFTRLIEQEPEVGDLMLVQIASTVPNHIVLYVGDGKILHHVEGRLSKIDPYGGAWRRFTTHHLRHASRMEVAHG
jgi:proteasome lid subunit RPN8/RPN11